MRASRSTRSVGRQGRRKVPRSYRLTHAELAAAQRILGTRTATETIKTVLDMMVFRHELIAGTRAWCSPDVTRRHQGSPGDVTETPHCNEVSPIGRDDGHVACQTLSGKKGVRNAWRSLIDSEQTLE